MSDAATPAEGRLPGRGRIYDSITQTIGDTPLVRIKRLAAEAGAKADVLLKLEFFNPIASVKDRIGVAMIEDLEARGVLTPWLKMKRRARSRAAGTEEECPSSVLDARCRSFRCGIAQFYQPDSGDARL